MSEQITPSSFLLIDKNLEVVVALDVQGVQVRLKLVAPYRYSCIKVLFLPLFRNRILVLNDKMDLIIRTTFIRPEHD